MATHTDPLWCGKHKRHLDTCSECLKESLSSYDPLREGYTPLSVAQRGEPKPPQGGTGETEKEDVLKTVEIDGEKIRDILPDLVEEFFPKHSCRERGEAIVLAAQIYIKIMDIQPIKVK